MSKHSAHLSDKDILLFVDAEDSPDQMERAARHLTDCPACCERLLALEATLKEIGDHYAAQTFREGSSPLQLRAQLEEKLAGAQPQRAWWQGGAGYSWYKTAAAVLILVAGFGLLGPGRSWIAHRVSTSQWAGSEPNASLTPGTVRPVTLKEVCSTGDDDLDPKVSPMTEKTVLKEYGVVPNNSGQNYQIDYLINPQLGGTNDIRNLWPQPYSNREWNAHAKDELEMRLRQMVCAGSVNLNVAQKEIATDWIAAYKKYFHQPYPA